MVAVHAGGVLPSLAGRILHRPLTDPAPFALSLVGAPLAFLLATVLLARTSGRVGNAVVGRSGAGGVRVGPPHRLSRDPFSLAPRTQTSVRSRPRSSNLDHHASSTFQFFIGAGTLRRAGRGGVR